MSPFWAGLSENLRGRGRNAALFIATLPVFLIIPVVLTKIPKEDFFQYVLPATACVALVGAILLIRGFVLARARNRERLARRSLSSDELRKARLKLVRQQTQAPSKNSLVTPG